MQSTEHSHEDIKLSVVIVNYNVAYFLEQCLHSVDKAIRGINAEVWVVDNASVDNSVSMLKEKFPWVKLIESKENLGFSKGNNLAIRQCTGEYILLLNPDTVVEEDTFSKCIAYMDAHPENGGLGVKMLDGNANYLPESKRGLPTPKVALYKLIGLTALFPRSEKFAAYYMGHLPNDETHEIEILSGAYMFMRKEALDKVGLLDEAFFMYGEDIDLSYRIIKGGYTNVYFPKTNIIHYKGESTKKGSVNYVMVFYQAMIIFANKHFSLKNAKLYQSFINLAIYGRAAMAILSRFVRRSFLPLIDFFMIMGSLYLVKDLYENYSQILYQSDLTLVAFTVYSLIWMITIYFSGGYDKPVKARNLMKGLSIATLIILAAYALLPEDLRFSRAIIVFGFFAVSAAFLISRSLLSLLKVKGYNFFSSSISRFAIVGSEAEIERVSSIIQQTNRGNFTFIHVRPDEGPDDENYVGPLTQLKEITSIYKINEVIFCAKDLSSQSIIRSMSSLDPGLRFKIAPPESLYIIGSNSIESAGDLYMLDVNTINRSANKRNKRSLDILLALIFGIFSPLLLFFQKAPIQFLKNIILVFFGKRSWVGYADNTKSNSSLPKLKKGVLNPMSKIDGPSDPGFIQKMNIIYAKDYSIGNDLRIIFSNMNLLGS